MTGPTREAVFDEATRLHDLRYGNAHCDRKYILSCSALQSVMLEASERLRARQEPAPADALRDAPAENVELALRLSNAANARDAAEAKLAEAERKVRAVKLLHVWTNEDGKRFVFADELAVALEISDAEAVTDR